MHNFRWISVGVPPNPLTGSRLNEENVVGAVGIDGLGRVWHEKITDSEKPAL
jgi:hypothetical protein